jgi:hypothetical protein
METAHGWICPADAWLVAETESTRSSRYTLREAAALCS